jgi:hypothetical protein
MNRNYQLFTLSLQKKVTLLFVVANIGATGAPTLQTNTPTGPRNKGIASLVRNSAGNYTVTMQDPYVILLSATMTQTVPTTGISAAPDFALVSNSNGAPAASLIFQLSSGGVATDPSSGSTLKMQIAYGSSTAQ